MRNQITSGLEQMGITPPPHAVEQLGFFAEQLLIQNQVMNLTAITDPVEVVDRHLLDSATLVPFLPPNATSLIDVGTGAGFPAIPLKILTPNLGVTLLDGLQNG